MIPSIKTMMSRLDLDRPTALKLRRLLAGKDSPDEYESVQKWIARCYHRPRPTERTLCAADEILGTHGVEVIEGPEYIDSYHANIRYSYCNTGDMYSGTLIRDHAKGRWIVADIGSILEKDDTLRG